MVRRILTLLVFLALFAGFYLLYLFMEANKAPVELTWVGWGGRTPVSWSAPAYLLGFASFLAGLLSASVLFVGQSIRQSWRLGRLKKRVRQLEQKEPPTPQPTPDEPPKPLPDPPTPPSP